MNLVIIAQTPAPCGPLGELASGCPVARRAGIIMNGHARPVIRENVVAEP